MGTCELLSQCSLHAYLSEHKPYALEHLEGDFCKNENAYCVRYMIYKKHGLSNVPRYIMPWDVHGARKFLETLKGDVCKNVM